MRKRMAVLLAVSALGVGGLAPGVAYAVDDDEVTEAADEGSDYGWIGLLGLAGLAGLMGLKRDDRHRTDTTRR